MDEKDVHKLRKRSRNRRFSPILRSANRLNVCIKEVIGRQDNQYGFQDTKKRRGESPGVSDISFCNRKRSALGQRSVEQPSRPSQRILDLGQVTNRYRLETQPIDVSLQVVQYYRAIAIAALTFASTPGRWA
jgi:hypothetical protein